MSDAAYHALTRLYDAGHALRDAVERHEWAVPLALIVLAVIGGGL